MLNNQLLFKDGFHLSTFVLTDDIKECVVNENWARLDEKFKILLKSDGEFFRFLNRFHEFTSIEFIISIRDADNEWEEDGIWHDDGSRVFAFSLSLTLDPENIEGGKLGVRKKGETSSIEIPTPKFGDVILFLTGVHGFEHKIHQVTKGQRIIIAGWCS